jgi:hypothetical protein
MLRVPRVRTLGVAAFAVLLSAIVAAPASSATPKKTYYVKVQVFDKQNPRASGECGLIAVAAFPRVKYASSASVTVKTSAGQRGFGAAGPGFHDVLKIAAIFEAPTDKHWVELGSGSQAGGQNADCSEQASRARAGITSLAKVVVTIDQNGACKRAKDAKKKTAADLARFRKELAAAPTESNAAQLNTVDYGVKLDKRAASEISQAC